MTTTDPTIATAWRIRKSIQSLGWDHDDRESAALFLLEKLARHPDDIEIAELAKQFLEFHGWFCSACMMPDRYTCHCQNDE